MIITVSNAKGIKQYDVPDNIKTIIISLIFIVLFLVGGISYYVKSLHDQLARLEHNIKLEKIVEKSKESKTIYVRSKNQNSISEKVALTDLVKTREEEQKNIESAKAMKMALQQVEEEKLKKLAEQKRIAKIQKDEELKRKKEELAKEKAQKEKEDKLAKEKEEKASKLAKLKQEKAKKIRLAKLKKEAEAKQKKEEMVQKKLAKEKLVKQKKLKALKLAKQKKEKAEKKRLTKLKEEKLKKARAEKKRLARLKRKKEEKLKKEKLQKKRRLAKNKKIEKVSKGSKKASILPKIAKSKLGKRYVWGAVGPSVFDCSGFTSYVYRKTGIRIPRTSRQQSRYGKLVDRKHLKPGDLIFFDTSHRRRGVINHVGMYIGNNQFIHASSAKKRVVITNLSNFYSKRFKWARRVIN